MKKIVLWGLTASPYQLKMQALLDYAGIAWERWPEQAGRLPALAMDLRLRAARRRGAVRRYPRMEEGLDEYPAVPYYTLDGRTFFYDSSSLAAHLDAHPDRGSEPLLPQAPALAFLCHLVDEAYDEFGLYMVHHQRWVGSARSNRMGEFTAREMGLPRSLVPARWQPALTPTLRSGASPRLAAGLRWRLMRRASRRCSKRCTGFHRPVDRTR